MGAATYADLRFTGYQPYLAERAWEGGYPTKEKMASNGAGSSSSGHIQQQQPEEADVNMGRATKRALEDQQNDDHKVHAARLDFATSIPVLSNVAIALTQLPVDHPRALLDRGNEGRFEKFDIRSKPSRSPRPSARNPIPIEDLQQTRRKLFSELPPLQGGVPMGLAISPRLVSDQPWATRRLPRAVRRMCSQ